MRESERNRGERIGQLSAVVPGVAAARDVREIVREEPAMRGRIVAAMSGGPLTIPEIAEAIGSPRGEVVFWVMAMRRYGYLAELPGADDEGYFRYRPTGRRAR